MSTPSSTWKVLHWTDAWPRPTAGDAHRPGTVFLGAAWMDSTWIPKAAATGQAVRNEADRASGRLSSLPKTVIASGKFVAVVYRLVRWWRVCRRGDDVLALGGWE